MNLGDILVTHARSFHAVVPFDSSEDRLYPFDFTSGNKDLREETIAAIDSFALYIRSTLERSGCRYGFGGYGEHRTIYARSTHFDGAVIPFDGRNPPAANSPAADSPAANPLVPNSFGVTPPAAGAGDPDSPESETRRLHLGIDIWGPADTPVKAPLEGIVHSFAFNNRDGDYGATLILTHSLQGAAFQTLYGHLSLNSLKNLVPGTRIRAGEVIGEFGMRFENGNWPPHLHFQVIRDMQGWEGDYPGVCRFSEKEQWMENCPDPDTILQMARFIKDPPL